MPYKSLKSIFIGVQVYFCLFKVGYSQTQYITAPEEEGYIILATLDTIKGYISFIREKDLYTNMKFRKNKDEPYKKIDPETVDYFFIKDGGGLFASKRVLEEQHPTVDSIASSPFVRVLVRGPASLYSFSFGGKSKYLVSNGVTIALLQKGNNRSKNIDGSLYNSGNKPYQKTLRKLLFQCTSVSPLLKYNYYDLSSLVTSYNDCSKMATEKYKIRKSKTMFGITLGYLSSDLKFKDQNAIVKPYNYSDAAPYGSYDVDFLLNETLKSSSFTLGLSLTNFVKDNKHVYINTMINYVNRRWSSDYFNIKADYLDIPLSINYNFGLANNIQPKLGVGVNLAVPISEKLESSDVSWEFYRTTVRQGAGDTWPSMLPVTMPVIFRDQFKPRMITPIINLGVDVKNGTSLLSITLSQGLPSSVTKSEIYKSSISYQMVTVTYSFLYK